MEDQAQTTGWDPPAPPKSVRDRLAGVRGRFGTRSGSPTPKTDAVPDADVHLVTDPGAHVDLGDLPGDVAERIRFENAAPRMARSKRLPPEARDALAAIWDDLIADVYDEQRFSTDPVYARHIGQLNILTYLIEHGDSNVGNFLISRAEQGQRVFSIDNGVAFAFNIVRILLIVGIIAWLGTAWVFPAHAVIGRVFFFTAIILLFWWLMTRPTIHLVRARVEERSTAGEVRGG